MYIHQAITAHATGTGCIVGPKIQGKDSLRFQGENGCSLDQAVQSASSVHRDLW